MVVVGTSLRAAQDEVSSLSLDSIEQAGGLRPAVQPTLDDVDRADRWMRSPLLGPLRVVPVLGDQVDGVRSMVGRLRTVADAGDRALDDVEAALARTGEPSGRVRLISTAIDALDGIEAEVDGLPAPDRDGLIGPVRAAHDRFEDELDELPDRFGELRDHLETVHDVLEGPTRVLLLAGNNAEMRAGMGMHLSAGVVTIADGDFETSEFVPTQQITPVTVGRADVPDDIARLHGGIWDIGHEWRTTSTVPDFPTVGAIFDQLAELTPIGDVDMVVSLDVPALASMLEATGPVEIDGEVISSTNAVELLLKDNYLRLGQEEQAAERRDLQSRIAGVLFETITERDLDVVDLAAQLSRAAEGRHLMAWSDDPGVQALWESLEADGALTDTSFLVAAQNASASKRDYYIDPVVDVVPVGTATAEHRRFRATLRLENPVVSPTNEYIDSLNRFVPVGVHRAYVTFTLPGAATDVEIVRGNPNGVGTEGPTVVAAVWLRVPESETGAVSVEFTLPTSVHSVDLVPGARVRPMTYHFGPATVTDETPVRVPLPWIAAYRPDEPEPLLAAAGVLLLAGTFLLVSRSRRLTADAPDVAQARVDASWAAAAFAAAVVAAVLGTLP